MIPRRLSNKPSGNSFFRATGKSFPMVEPVVAEAPVTPPPRIIRTTDGLLTMFGSGSTFEVPDDAFNEINLLVPLAGFNPADPFGEPFGLTAAVEPATTPHFPPESYESPPRQDAKKLRV
jgi:hypothetical protein